MTWLVKRDHYDGGESVIDTYADEKAANERAQRINTDYQSDNYYVEQWDAKKFNWPDAKRTHQIVDAVIRKHHTR